MWINHNHNLHRQNFSEVAQQKKRSQFHSLSDLFYSVNLSDNWIKFTKWNTSPISTPSTM
jgi:hypothetical protein